MYDVRIRPNEQILQFNSFEEAMEYINGIWPEAYHVHRLYHYNILNHGKLVAEIFPPGK